MLKNFFDKNIAIQNGVNLYKPRVAVVAIAKDEGAYIHEWLHHYLYMGFEKIFIGINRTTDDTAIVLSKAQKKFECIYFEDVSWLDQACIPRKNPQIQSLTYAYFANEIRTKHDEITHVLFCDIDEFWFSKDFGQDVASYIGTLPKFDAVSFNWLNQNGDASSFEKPFSNLTYQSDRHMKTIHSVQSIPHIVEFRCHASRYYSKYQQLHIDSTGKQVKYGEHDQAFKNQPSLDRGAFVLHRWVRSQLEYTAMLLRERPGVEVPIKNNRFGFVRGEGRNLDIENGSLQHYWNSLNKFISFCDLNALIDSSRVIIEEKSKRILEIKPELLVKYIKSYFSVLKGTEYRLKIIDVLDSENLSYLKDEHAKDLFDIGIQLENENEAKIALRFLELAHNARPEGPVILENLKRLRKMLD